MRLPPLKEGGDFKITPEGRYNAVLVDVIDKGIVTGSFGPKHLIAFVFQTNEPVETDDGSDIGNYCVYDQFSYVVSEGSNYYKRMNQWFAGKGLTPEKLAATDPESFIGQQAEIVVAHNKSKDGQKTFANIASIMQPRPNDPKVAPHKYDRWHMRPDNAEEYARRQQSVELFYNASTDPHQMEENPFAPTEPPVVSPPESLAVQQAQAADADLPF